MHGMKELTNSNQNNLIEESILEDIRKKVFNQSMLNTMQLADREV